MGSSKEIAVQVSDKSLNRLRRRFERTLEVYPRAAQIQEKLAKDLVRLLPKGPYMRVLELGVGTGFLTQKLLSFLPKGAFYLAIDLVFACKQFLKTLPVYFLLADAEDLSWLKGKFDLIISNATFQWFREPSQALEIYRKSLVSGGVLAFSTFGPETMKEARRAALRDSSLLRPLSFWRVQARGFQVLVEERTIYTLYFDKPLEVLRHIRQTGALGSLPPCWSLKALRAFDKHYKAFEDKKGFPLTYEAYLFIWQKK